MDRTDDIRKALKVFQVENPTEVVTYLYCDTFHQYEYEIPSKPENNAISDISSLSDISGIIERTYTGYIERKEVHKADIAELRKKLSRKRKEQWQKGNKERFETRHYNGTVLATSTSRKATVYQSEPIREFLSLCRDHVTFKDRQHYIQNNRRITVSEFDYTPIKDRIRLTQMILVCKGKELEQVHCIDCDTLKKVFHHDCWSLPNGIYRWDSKVLTWSLIN